MIKTGRGLYDTTSGEAGYVYVFKGYGRRYFAEQHKQELNKPDYDFLLSTMASGRAFRFRLHNGRYSLSTKSEEFYRERGYKIIEFDNYERLKEKQRTE